MPLHLLWELQNSLQTEQSLLFVKSSVCAEVVPNIIRETLDFYAPLKMLLHSSNDELQMEQNTTCPENFKLL